MTNSVVKESLNTERVQARQQELLENFRNAVALADLLASTHEMMSRNRHIWNCAHNALQEFLDEFDVPVPLLSPLQYGGFGVEWHECDLNIELRFRPSIDSSTPRRVYVLIEDARGELGSFYNYDNDLSRVRLALRELAIRRA